MRSSFMKLLVITAACWLLVASLNIAGSPGKVSAQQGHVFISDPGKIPWFDDWETPVIEPGDDGVLEFTVTNRYFEPSLESNNLTDVSLTLGIYELATLDKNRKVNNAFNNPPRIVESLPVDGAPNSVFEGNDGIITQEPETGVGLFRFTWEVMPVNATYFVKVKITTDGNTPEGSYTLKTELRFMHNGIENHTFTMRSLGFFSEAEWDYAVNTAPEEFTGNINLSALEIDGIIPETSFTVRRPVPFWPFYVIAGITAMFAAMAVVFYYMEEYDKFPGLKKLFDRNKR